MKSYCVKQKKQSECFPGSENLSTTKNGRRMMKCKCVECGKTKTKFVVGSSTGRAKPRISRTTTTKNRGRSKKTGQGLLLGRNSPFNKITLIGAILLAFHNLKTKFNSISTYIYIYMSYCTRQKKMTLDLPGSEEIIQAKNGGWRVRSVCIECNATKSRLISKKEGKGLEELFFKAGTKGLYNLGKIGVSKALKK